ncbi:hypothetical protein [Cohnella soli]|uniref:Uncharacterized protein n=1 Tax=Cohnella soli TaxID=425005 RepID=A0ABW0HTK7_9BACL
MKDTELLIWDEAISALDLVTERKVQQELDLLRKTRTIIVIAHRLSTIQDADRIFILRKGTIIESGTHDELLSNESEYYSLVKNEVEPAFAS